MLQGLVFRKNFYNEKAADLNASKHIIDSDGM
jgi:hypothetical protein